MALSASRRAAERISLRSVFIKVRPAPRRLSERRAILRTLQSYGEIEVFQPLTDPCAFNAVATKAVTVQHLILKSPLQFDYVPESRTSNQDLTTGGVPRDIYQLHQAMGSSDSRQSFTLSIFPSDTEHRHQVQKSPLHGQWPSPNTACGPVKSFVTSALKQVVPRDMAAKGLQDWETGGQALKKLDRGYSNQSSLVGAIVQRRADRRERQKAHAIEMQTKQGGFLQRFRE